MSYIRLKRRKPYREERDLYVYGDDDTTGAPIATIFYYGDLDLPWTFSVFSRLGVDKLGCWETLEEALLVAQRQWDEQRHECLPPRC